MMCLKANALIESEHRLKKKKWIKITKIYVYIIYCIYYVCWHT